MNKKTLSLICFMIILPLLGCQEDNGPTRPDFSVISSPEIPVISQVTATPILATETPVPVQVPANTSGQSSVFEMQPAKVLPETVEATTPPTITPIPTDTAEPEVIATAVTTAATTTPPQPDAPPDEPRVGGSWDMEDGFEVWINPYGDDCSGSMVAAGWKGFTSRGQYGSSCFYLNDFAPNVFSGGYSQLVTFDFVDSHAGLYRAFDSQPGHTYQVKARIRHVHTLPPMQYHFGFDLSGETNWEAESVQWSPWAEFREDEWITHTQSFTATGTKTAIFIKGFHSAASQGGATYIDTIEIIDQGG